MLQMMKQARWALKRHRSCGRAAHVDRVMAAHAALAVPIAYAVVGAAVVVIGMDFADVGLIDLIPGVRSIIKGHRFGKAMPG